MRPDFASLLGVSAERVRVEYLGLNHVGWVTDVQVDGISCMNSLVERLIQGRVKRYNYDLIRAFDVIPVQHAYSLYHKGETFYVRQKGIRGSASDVLLRPRLLARLARWRAQREALGEVVRTGQRGALGLLAERAPWYAACIVPFLQDVAAARPAEHIVTWQHAGQMPGMPFATAETTAVIEGRRARPAAVVGRLPAVAQVWLRQVRDSERLFIQAVREGSFALAVEALAVHPNVASVRHAARFLRPYFRSTLERV
jgi:6-phospho-beta-glucosidase